MLALAVLIGLAVLASPVAVVVLFLRLRRLERRLAAGEDALAALRAGPPLTPEAPAPAPAAQDVLPAARPAPPRGMPWRPAPVTAAGLEEAFTARWMVWLGGAALALAAVFLFRFAVEQGVLGPRARVGMGLALGAALVAAGDWADRRRPAALARALRPDYAGPALTAAGIFALYVSLFAAHALYALLGSAAAFAALALASALALGLARRQGWFVALLGLAGGYAIPALVASDAPRAAPLFVFLLALTAGCLALATVRNWWFLAPAALAGALGWPLLWLAGPWTVADQGVLGLYAVGIAGLFGVLSVALPVPRPQAPAAAWLAGLVSSTAGIGYGLSGALLVLLAFACDFNGAAFALLGIHAAVGLALGLRHPASEPLALAAALVAVAAFLLWPAPATVSPPAELQRMGVASYADTWGPFVLPPEFLAFARALAGFAALFGLGGFAALRQAPTPGFWAALSAALPVTLLALGYWRIDAFAIDIRWSALATGLALAGLAAAAAVPRLLPPGRRDGALGAYAAGSTAAMALALACLMREAWLTVALALEVLALAWIWSRLRLPAIRAVAFAAVAVVIVRLVLNWWIVDYRGTAPGLFSWVLYGYGLPAAAFLGAARLLRTEARDPLADLCEIAATAFLFLMVALQLRIWTAGAIDAPAYDLFDKAVQSAWWLIAGAMLLRRELAARLPWARVGGLALVGLASTQIVLGHLLADNPLGTAEPVGALPLVNLLGLAYLLPAVLLGAIGASDAFALPPRARAPLVGLAGLLAFVYLTLEVRRAFHGPVLTLDAATRPLGAELYAYSAAWILFALALLAVGILRRSQFWRGFSLAVLIATVLKVFLYDMSDLIGLLRVASFLGLGLALIGIGQLYRRFVFAR